MTASAKHHLSLNRRSFFRYAAAVASALLTAPTMARARSATPVANEATARLLVGNVDGSFAGEMFAEIGIFDDAGELVGQLDHPGGVVSMQNMARPGMASAIVIDGPSIANLKTQELETVDWDGPDPQFMISASPDSDSIYVSESYVLTSDMEFQKGMLIDLDTMIGEDVTDHIVGNDQDFVPIVPTYSRTSALCGVWTGDHVWLIDLSNPSSGRPLLGDDEDDFSTGVSISNDDRFCTFTTYSGNDRGKTGDLYFEHVDGTSRTKIATGTAWSQSLFIPSNDEEFLVMSDRGIEVRKMSDPETTGDVLGDIGGTIHRNQIWNTDFTRLLVGDSESEGDVVRWRMVDLEQRSVIELPDLEGHGVIHTGVVNSRLAHVLFGPLSGDETATGSIKGFTFATGETHTFFEDVKVSQSDVQTGSFDGTWFALQLGGTREVRGVYLINLETRETHKFPYGDGDYAVNGRVSPDGSVVAVTMLTQPGKENRVELVRTSHPDEAVTIDGGVALTWVTM